MAQKCNSTFSKRCTFSSALKGTLVVFYLQYRPQVYCTCYRNILMVQTAIWFPFKCHDALQQHKNKYSKTDFISTPTATH